MKLINQKGIDALEKSFDCSVMSDQLDGEIKMLFTDKAMLTKAIKTLDGCPTTVKDSYLSIHQIDFYNYIKDDSFFDELRVWTGGSVRPKAYVPTKDMEHQRLSNCLGLLDMLLTTGNISHDKADTYLKALTPVVDELSDRFGGELLPYIPYYQWEKDMAEKANKL